MTQAEIDTQIKEIEKQMVEYVKGGRGGVPDLPFCDMVLFIGMKYLYIKLLWLMMSCIRRMHGCGIGSAPSYVSWNDAGVRIVKK